MSTPTVVEIDSFTDDTEPSYYSDLADAGVVGVLIKVSQGTRWTLRDAPEKVRRATAAGLHVGALHYLEPAGCDATGLTHHFIGNLPPASYSLGLVLELDDLGGLEFYELGPVLQDALVILRQHGHVGGVRLNSDAALALSSNIAGARLWLDGEVPPGSRKPFAVALTTPLMVTNGHEFGYRLMSARMLNADDGTATMTTEPEPGDDGHPTEADEAGLGSPGSLEAGTAGGPPEPEPEVHQVTPPEVHSPEGEGEAEPEDLADARANALANL